MGLGAALNLALNHGSLSTYLLYLGISGHVCYVYFMHFIFCYVYRM